MTDPGTKAPRRLLRGFALAGVALVASLALAELALRVVVPLRKLTPVADVYAPHSRLGYALKPSIDVHAMNERLVTNSHGFRGREWEVEHAPDVLRVALVGDSHAFGYGVDVDRAVASRLEHHLDVVLRPLGRRSEVLNFGVPGFNARQQHAAFEHVARRFDPDVVVVMPCNNDDEDAPVVGPDGWLHSPGAAEGDDDRIAPWQERAFDRRLNGWLGGLRLYRLANFVWLKYTMRPRHDVADTPSMDGAESFMPVPIPAVRVPQAMRDRVAEPIGAILRGCREDGMPAVLAPFAVAPAWRRLFADLASEHGVPLVELLALFPECSTYAALQRRYGLGWDAHLGPDAHERWAAALAPRILAQ